MGLAGVGLATYETTALRSSVLVEKHVVWAETANAPKASNNKVRIEDKTSMVKTRTILSTAPNEPIFLHCFSLLHNQRRISVLNNVASCFSVQRQFDGRRFNQDNQECGVRGQTILCPRLHS